VVIKVVVVVVVVVVALRGMGGCADVLMLTLPTDSGSMNKRPCHIP
jgi:uncharacterized protein YceK